MPADTSTPSEINGKRKAKNKMPKRLRHRRREQNTNEDSDSKQNQPSEGKMEVKVVDDVGLCDRSEHSILRKEKVFQETTPFFINALRLTTEQASMPICNDQTSVSRWTSVSSTSFVVPGLLLARVHTEKLRSSSETIFQSSTMVHRKTVRALGTEQTEMCSTSPLRSQERLEAIQRLLFQREQIESLTEQNHSVSNADAREDTRLFK